jgi:parvulin-like peptidyl-prolyl isomerase
MHMKSLVSTLLPVLVTLAPAAAIAQGDKPQAKKTAKPEIFRARHILITWKGSPTAKPENKLTKAEALTKAQEIYAALQAEGTDFATLARTASACPSRAVGGYLGQFRPGQMIPKFETAVLGCEIGSVTKPVETAFGYHLILRMPIDKEWPAKLRASHILIAYEGARSATTKRTKEAARKLAHSILAELKKGTKWAELVTKHTDDKGTAPQAGSLGTRPPSGFFSPLMTDALVALESGKVGGPLETEFGFHVLRRDAVPIPYKASHILVPWKGVSSAAADIVRTKKEALALATKILAEIKAGSSFSQLAKKHSTCPSGAAGGNLGEFSKGQMVPPFEKAVSETKVGGLIGPVETAFGYHVILRTQ